MSKKKENTIGMAAMLHFADLGFSEVFISFSGGGDSGDMGDPQFYKKDEKHVNVGGKEEAKRRQLVKPEILEEFKEEVNTILSGIEDWWNNDGGQGDITIQIPTGEYQIAVSINYTKTQDYTHSGTITDQ